MKLEKMILADTGENKGASQLHSAVLVNKIHNIKINYVGIDIEDRYLFGFDMNYKNYLRNVNAVHAIKGM